MFGGLTERLTKVFDKLTGRGLITEAVLDETAREIRIALLEADVALPVVKEFINKIKEKAVGQEVVKSIQPAQMVVKIVHDELVSLLGESTPLKANPYQTNVLMMVGLQGSGKTTTTAKIALKLKKEGKRVLLASLDTYRPAAQEQLAELGQKNELDVLPIVAGEKPLEIAGRAIKVAEQEKYDWLIWDTAGRLAVDEEMMRELVDLQKFKMPAETLLVLDTLMGQDALNVVKAFQEKITLTGLVLTRVDGDARGGVALSVRQITGLPIQYMGVGEKVDALEAFDAKRIADRILGMGDVVGLVETAMEKVNQEDMAEQAMRMMQGQFTLEDLLAQLKQMDKLGDVKGIMKMIPGVARFAKQIDESKVDNRLIRRQQAIILAMTPKERKHPEILKAARKLRIAAGAGVKVEDVNRLLKSYEQMADVMKKFKKMGPFGMMSMMKKMGVNPGSMMNGGGFPPFKV
ncbi:MAG: signal recognition particle protein [Alphaproteobacteria bacterium]|nr:signal recognition particle protein [Alphaproteobacteria bacterium]